MTLHIDLHTHSHFSGDGVSSPEELIAAARHKGLHGIALTDHNTCAGVEELLRKGLMREDGQPMDGFLVIPGVEITAREGHILCLGVTMPERIGAPAADVCREIRARGGLAIPAHPFDTFRAGAGEALAQLEVDALEVFNAATTLQSCNRKAFAYAEARGIPMMSGSDAHHAAALGTAYMILETDDFTLAGVLRQVVQPGNRLVQKPSSPWSKLYKTFHMWRNWVQKKSIKYKV